MIFALGGIYGRRFRHLSPMQTAAGQMIASTIFLVPIAAVVDQPWALPSPSIGAWAALVAMGVFSTALGFVVFFKLLGSAGAANTSLVGFLIPITALLLGGLILGERITADAVAGMLLIALGLAWSDGRLFRWLKRARAS